MRKAGYTLLGRTTVLMVVLLATCNCAAKAFVDDFDDGYQTWLKWDGIDTYMVDNNPGVLKLATEANAPNDERRATSKELFTYGIYEIRFRATNDAGNYLYFGFFSRSPWANPIACMRVDGNLMLAAGNASGSNWDALSPNSPYLTPGVWHTVRMIWQPGSIESIYDGVSLGTYTQYVPSTPLPVIMDVLNGPGSSAANVLEVDYVTVTAVPEPSSLLSLVAASGALGGMLIRRRTPLIRHVPESLHSGSVKTDAHRRAFTLIELLVVIAIIMVLAAILFPVFTSAKESARRAYCLSSERQLASAVLLYCQDHDEYYPLYSNATRPQTFWFDSIRPYERKGKNVRDQIALKGCPSSDKYFRYGYNYLALGHININDPTKRPRKTSEILRASRLAMIMDTNDSDYDASKGLTGSPAMIYWGPGGDPATGDVYVIGDLRPKAHGGDAVNVAWADGHCSYFSLVTLWNNGDITKYFGTYTEPIK